MADGDLCTVAQVKEALGIPEVTTTADALLARFIAAASAAFVSAAEDPVLEADYDERYAGSGQSALVLRHAPVALILSVSSAGVAIPAATTETAVGWYLDDRTLRLRGSRFCGGPGAVRVRYIAGYAVELIPADIQDAVIDTVALAYRRQDNFDVASKSLAGESISYITSAMRPRARAVLEQRRERVPA